MIIVWLVIVRNCTLKISSVRLKLNLEFAKNKLVSIIILKSKTAANYKTSVKTQNVHSFILKIANAYLKSSMDNVERKIACINIRKSRIIAGFKRNVKIVIVKIFILNQ